MAEKVKLPKNLDEMVDYINKTSSKDIDSAFEAVGKFENDENQNHFYNNMFTPALQEMYNTFKDNLRKSVKGDDNTKLKKKKSDVYRATIEGLKKFFAKVSPSVLKTFEKELKEDMKDDDKVEKLYKVLAQQYDNHIGAVGENYGKGISALIESLVNENKEAGTLIKMMGQYTGSHANNLWAVINDQNQAHHLGRYRPIELGAHIHKKYGKAIKMHDKTKFYSHGKEDYLTLEKGLRTGSMPKDVHLKEHFGVEYSKEEAKKPAGP